jgi:hypothetical protein
MITPQAETKPSSGTMTKWMQNDDLPGDLLKMADEYTVHEHTFSTQFEGHVSITCIWYICKWSDQVCTKIKVILCHALPC